MLNLFDLNTSSSIPSNMFANSYLSENYVASMVNTLDEMNHSLTEANKVMYTNIAEAEDTKKENSIMKSFLMESQSILQRLHTQMNEQYSRFSITLTNYCDMARETANKIDVGMINPYTDKYVKYDTNAMLDSDVPRMHPHTLFEKEFIFLAQLLQDLPVTVSHKEKLEIVATVYNKFAKTISEDLEPKVCKDMFGDECCGESSFTKKLISIFKAEQINTEIGVEQFVEAKTCINNGRDYLKSVSESFNMLENDLQRIIDDLNRILIGADTNKYIVDTKEDGVRNTSYSVDIYTSNKILLFVRDKIEQVSRVYSKYLIAMSVKMDMIIGHIKQNISIINSMDYTTAEVKAKVDALSNNDNTDTAINGDGDIDNELNADQNDDISTSNEDDIEDTDDLSDDTDNDSNDNLELEVEEDDDQEDLQLQDMSNEVAFLQESFNKEYSDEQFQQFIEDFKNSENKNKSTIEQMFNAVYMKDNPKIMCSRYGTILSALRTFIVGDITAGVVQLALRTINLLIYFTVMMIITYCKTQGGIETSGRLLKAIQSELEKVDKDIKKHPNKKKELESFKKSLKKAEKRVKNYKSSWASDGKAKFIVDQYITDSQRPVFESIDDPEWEDALTEFFIQLHEYTQVSDKISVLEHTSSLLNEDGLEKTKEMVGKLKEEKQVIWKKIINSILKLWEKFKENVLQRYEQKVKYLKDNIKYINMDRINSEISMPTIDHKKIDDITVPDLNYNAMKSHLGSEEDFMKSQMSWKDITPQKDGETIASKVKDYVIDTNNLIKNAAELDPSVLYTEYCARFLNIMDDIKKDIDVIKKGEKRADQVASHVTESYTPTTADELYFNEDGTEEKKENDSFKAGDDTKESNSGGGDNKEKESSTNDGDKEQKSSSDNSDVSTHLQVYFKTCGKVLAAKMTVSQKVFKEYFAYLNWHISKKKKNGSTDDSSTDNTDNTTDDTKKES